MNLGLPEGERLAEAQPVEPAALGAALCAGFLDSVQAFGSFVQTICHNSGPIARL